LSEMLQVDAINGKQHIVVNDAKSEQFSDGFAVSAGLSGFPKSWLIGSSFNITGGGDFKTLQDAKSLNDQLNELNKRSENTVKWDIEGTRVVPKSINVVKVIRAKMSKTLTFRRVQ